MSKIGRKPIKIAKDITVNISGQEVTVTGPKGTLSQKLKPEITIKKNGDNLELETKSPKNTATLGLYRSILFNMIYGVGNSWNKGLELKGVGYRAQVAGDKLSLNIGFSHPVEITIPKGISISVVENKINVSGIDKQLVGEIAATIRAVRPPEPYKGKGIRYIGEKVRRKLGKQAVKVAGTGGGA